MVSFHKKFQPVSVDGNQSSSGGKYLFTTEGLPSDLSLHTSLTGCFRKKDKCLAGVLREGSQVVSQEQQ